MASMGGPYMQAYRDMRRARGVCLDCPKPTDKYSRCVKCRRTRAMRKWRKEHIRAA